MDNNQFGISTPPPEDWASAVGLLLDDLPADVRPRVVAELLAEAGPGALDGLLAAHRGGRMVGVAWAQAQPGGTAVVWPPWLVAGEPEETAGLLLAAACQLLERQGITLAQSLLSATAGHQSARLQAAGFVPMAELVFLVCTRAAFPRGPVAGPVEFEAYRPANHQRLAAVVLATYQGTLDCPQMSGLRGIEDVLEGYRATGQFDPQHWLIVRHAGGDVGCLLLADHPRMQHMELVYMGLVPDARGNGWGRAMVRHAQWLARRRDRSQLVLAVDQKNLPALAMYEAASFVDWDNRSVWMRSMAGRPLVGPIAAR